MTRIVTRGLTALALAGLTSLAMISPSQAVECPAGTYPPGECIPSGGGGGGDVSGSNPGATSGSGLPFTGFELGAASLLGAALLGAGTVAVVSARRRRDALGDPSS